MIIGYDEIKDYHNASMLYVILHFFTSFNHKVETIRTLRSNSTELVSQLLRR